jgi:multiple sugar transport system substrate-binding protein
MGRTSCSNGKARELTNIFSDKVDAQTDANNIATAWEKLTDQTGREQIGLHRASSCRS